MSQISGGTLNNTQTQGLSQHEIDYNRHKLMEELKSKPRVKLDFLNAFGMYTGSQLHDLHNCLNFLEEADQSKLMLTYPVGRQIGVRELKSNEMKFIRQHENLKEITAMCLSPNKKFLASCELLRDDKCAYITFYDMKSQFFKNTQNHINVCEGQSPTNQRYITSIVFSNDSTFVACLLNVPDCKVLIYEWFKKNRVIASFDFHKTEVTRISFHPKDNHKVIVSGNGVMQMYSMQEGSLKPLQQFRGLPQPSRMDDTMIFSDHTWNYPDEDLLIGCTKGGDLFVIDNYDVVQTLPFDSRASYTTLRSFNGGLVAATEDGILHFYRSLPEPVQTDSKQKQSSSQVVNNRHPRFEFVRKWTCDSLRNYKIVSLAIYELNKDSEIYLAVATKNQNIVYLNMMKQFYFPQGNKNLGDNSYMNAGGNSGQNSFISSSHNINGNQFDDLNSMIPADEIQYETVAKGFHSGPITSMDISIQRPILVTASKEDSTIRFWNYYTGQCELSRRYFVKEKDHQGGEKLRDQDKPLLSVTLHPSGYYMAAGFTYNVRIMHVLHDELRDFRTLEIKNCNKMKFSNGGQFLALTDQKKIYIYASYTVENLLPNNKPLQCPSQFISDIAFNSTDTCMVVISNDGYLYRYDLISFQKRGEGVINRDYDFRACLFLADPNDDFKVLSVGSDLQRAMFKMYNHKEDKQLDIVCSNDNAINAATFTKKYTEVKAIRSFVSGIENLIVGTDRGQIKIFTMPPFLQQDMCFDTFNAHLGEVTKVLVSPDGRYVFSAGADGTVFVYSVTEYANEQTIVKQEVNVTSIKDEQTRLQEQQQQQQEIIKSNNLNTSQVQQSTTLGYSQLQSVVEKELAQIVMVKKSVMEQWRKRQEQLRAEMEEEKSKVDNSLRHEKYKYEQQITQMEKTKSDQLNDLNKRYEDLQQQEAEQKDENTQTMKKMELNHLQCMEELQTLYEKKLAIENQNYTKLEKEKGEKRQEYENQIKLLQRQNEEAIEKLLNEFKNNLGKVQDEYEDSKRTADGLKTMYEEKLTQQEDEHEAEISELKALYKSEQEKLEDVIGTLKNDIETIKRQIKRIQDEKDQFISLKEKASKKKKKLKELLEEKKVLIKQLEEEKKEVQEKLKKKETELYKYKFKIKDLQKTKQVLTHRTQEMKSSLEPKEQQIENLKEQLLDLEKVFEKQSKAMQNLKDDVDRRQDKISELTQSVQSEKNETKQKEKTIQSFVNDIHKIVQQKDEKSYVTGLMRIYDLYVKKYSDEILEKKKKDPETIEELDRQLKYMEKSISTLKQNTSKNEVNTKLNIKKKTKENTELIHELNELRVRKRELENELDAKNLTFSKLKLEKDRREREQGKKSHHSHHSNSMMRGPRNNNFNINGTDDLTSQQQQQYYTRPRSGSTKEEIVGFSSSLKMQNKGKLFKGTPFNYLKGSVEDKQRIQELISGLEDNNQQILLQKLEIRSLKDQIIRLLEERGGFNANNQGDAVNSGGVEGTMSVGASPSNQGGNTSGNQNSNVRIGAKMSKDKEGFLPRVDSKQRI